MQILFLCLFLFGLASCSEIGLTELGGEENTEGCEVLVQVCHTEAVRECVATNRTICQTKHREELKCQSMLVIINNNNNNNNVNNNNHNNNHREELNDPYSVNECLPDVRLRCETLVRVEEVDHTEEECTICKQGYNMEVVKYTDTECVTTYSDSCSWGGDPNRAWSTNLNCDKIPHEECRDVEKTRQVEVPWQECSQEVASDKNQPSAASVVNLRQARAFFYAFVVSSSAKDANSIHAIVQSDDVDDLESAISSLSPAKDAKSMVKSDQAVEDLKKARSSDESTTTRYCEDVVRTRKVEVPHQSCKNVSVQACSWVTKHKEVVLVPYKDCTSEVKEECTLKKEKKVCDEVKQETEDCKNILPPADRKELNEEETNSVSAAPVVNLRTPKMNIRRMRKRRIGSSN